MIGMGPMKGTLQIGSKRLFLVLGGFHVIIIRLHI